MMDRAKIVLQFEGEKKLLLDECQLMSDDKYSFNLGMLAAYGLVLKSQKNNYERKYADVKCECDKKRKGLGD